MLWPVARCEGIATYAACVDAIADGSKEDESVTRQKDALYQKLACADADMIVQPIIRTERGDLKVQVNADAKFTRHKVSHRPRRPSAPPRARRGR